MNSSDTTLSTNKTEESLSKIFQNHFSITNIFILFLLYIGILIFYSASQELEFINKFTNNEHIIALYIIYLIIILCVGLAFKLNEYYKYYMILFLSVILICLILIFVKYVDNMYQSIIYFIMIVIYLYLIYCEYVKIK